jgi:hypothetical protein
MSDSATAIMFLDLPVELTEHALVYLHPLEIVRCRQESHDIVLLPTRTATYGSTGLQVPSGTDR